MMAAFHCCSRHVPSQSPDKRVRFFSFTRETIGLDSGMKIQKTPQGNLQMGRILAAFVICVLCLATSASSKAVLRFIAGEHKRLSNGVRIWLQYHRFCFHFGSPFIARQCDIVPFFQIQLKLNASDPGSLAAERHLHMPNGLALTYGAIVALAGDHYGVPERPISDGTTQVCLSNTVCVLLKAVFPHHVHSLLPHLRLTN